MATPSNNPSCCFIHTLLSESSISPTVKAFSTVVSELGEINIGVADIMANVELMEAYDQSAHIKDMEVDIIQKAMFSHKNNATNFTYINSKVKCQLSCGKQ